MKSSEVRKAGDQSIYLKLIFKLKLITPTYPTFFFFYCLEQFMIQLLSNLGHTCEMGTLKFA